MKHPGSDITLCAATAAFQRGIVPVWWDNGYLSNHQFGLFNRSTGAQGFPELISAIVNNAK